MFLYSEPSPAGTDLRCSDHEPDIVKHAERGLYHEDDGGVRVVLVGVKKTRYSTHHTLSQAAALIFIYFRNFV